MQSGFHSCSLASRSPLSNHIYVVFSFLLKNCKVGSFFNHENIEESSNPVASGSPVGPERLSRVGIDDIWTLPRGAYPPGVLWLLPELDGKDAGNTDGYFLQREPNVSIIGLGHGVPHTEIGHVRSSTLQGYCWAIMEPQVILTD